MARIELSEFLGMYETSINHQQQMIDIVESGIQKWRNCESDAPFASQRVEGLLKADKAEKHKAKLLEELEVEKNRECTLLYFYEYAEERGFEVKGDGLVETYTPPKTLCTSAKMKACEVRSADIPKHEGKTPSRIMVEINYFSE
jgi:hypothetical protein